VQSGLHSASSPSRHSALETDRQLGQTRRAQAPLSPPALPADVRPPGPESNRTPSPDALALPGLPLIPGQAIEPIDLAGVLRLAGARDLDIALARQQVFQAIADLQRARALWLPSLFLGPTWYRLDGQVQAIDGKVMTVSRSSLSIGGLAASPTVILPPLRGAASRP